MSTPKTQPDRVFQISIGLCSVAAISALIYPELVQSKMSELTTFMLDAIGSGFVWAAQIFLVLAIGLALSPMGKRRLGPDDSRPDFSTLSWLSMLFAAGMGTGLVIWGMSEPMTHMLSPPTESADAFKNAFIITNFHWGIHAWAIYGVGALSVAYFGFVRGTPYLPSSPIRDAFRGPWVEPVGHLADVLAILAVAFGVAGSMAMGTMQVHSGLSWVTDIPIESIGTDMAILGLLFVAYMISSTTGLDRGIKILSNLNMMAALALLGALFWWSDTAAMTSAVGSRLIEYTAALPALTTQLNPFNAEPTWFNNWTLVYLVWWVAWTPFVGIFIARISRGRTIREFVLGVLIVPTVFSVVWFAVFGQVGIDAAAADPEGYALLLKSDITAVMFRVFDTLPAPTVLAVLATVLASVFLVTSVDSATYVLGMLSSRGSLEPGTKIKVIWGVALGILGASFALSGNVDSVKAMMVFGAIPFLFILLLQVCALGRVLWEDSRKG